MEPPGPTLELDAFASLHFGQFTAGHTSEADDLVVDDAHAILADRTHTELRLEGHAELANHDDVKWRIECPCNFVGDRHAAPGQAEHHHRAMQMLQPRGKTTPGVGTIDKGHNDLLPLYHLLAATTSTPGSMVPTSITGRKTGMG